MRLDDHKRPGREGQAPRSQHSCQDIKYRSKQHMLDAIDQVPSERHVHAKQMHEADGEQGPGGHAMRVEVGKPPLVEG